MSVLLFNSFSSNYAVLMKAPRARLRGLLTRTRRKTLKTDPKGGPKLFVYPKSYFFCDLQLHAKFHNPRTTLLGEKYVARKESGSM